MLRYIRTALIVGALLSASLAATSTYTVRRGDTLSAIAAPLGVRTTDLMRTNNLRDPNYIEAGRVLNLPNAPVQLGPRGAGAFAGLGAWVDLYDFSPEYQVKGRTPPVTPAVVDKIAASGAKTLYLQAGSSTRGVVDPPLLAAFLTRAHAKGMRVAAWYLPALRSASADLKVLTAIRDFRARGQRFDAIGVDIEATPMPVSARNATVIDLSRRLRGATAIPLGAIVMPPVQLDVVNPNFWPDFPWKSLAASYDAWLPMDYWTLRTTSSGWRDPARYTTENVNRLRAHLGNSAAAVHPVGGIGTPTGSSAYQAFVKASRATRSVGWSVYDFWSSR